MIGETVKKSYEKKDKKAPQLVITLDKVFNSLMHNKRVKLITGIVNFIWMFIIPHYYYGYVRGTLLNFY